MQVLVVDNYDSFTFNLVQILKQSRKCKFEVRKNDEIKLEQVQNYDKILLSPGPDLPQQAGKMPAIIQNFASQKSILGICLGHQAIAEFFGAKLFRLKKVRHGMQHKVQILDSSDILFRNLPQEILVGLYHSWAVENELLPKHLQITSIDENQTIMSISHTQFDIKGIQFHPESMMTEWGSTMIENWLSN